MKKTTRKSLSEFFGCLSPESAAKMKKAIQEHRKLQGELHQKRIARLCKEMNG